MGGEGSSALRRCGRFNEKNRLGMTPKAIKGSAAGIEALASGGADWFNLRDKIGKAPLDWAAFQAPLSRRFCAQAPFARDKAGVLTALHGVMDYLDTRGEEWDAKRKYGGYCIAGGADVNRKVRTD